MGFASVSFFQPSVGYLEAITWAPVPTSEQYLQSFFWSCKYIITESLFPTWLLFSTLSMACFRRGSNGSGQLNVSSRVGVSALTSSQV